MQKTSRRQDSEEELPKPKRKRIPRKVKLIIKATVPAKQFEKFFCRHYEAEEGEGKNHFKLFLYSLVTSNMLVVVIVGRGQKCKIDLMFFV